MITIAKKLYLKRKKKKPNMDRQNPRTNGKSKATQIKSHKVHQLNFRMICCPFRYSRHAEFIKLIVEI